MILERARAAVCGLDRAFRGFLGGLSMGFQKLDMNAWRRAPIFRHFMDDTRMVLGLTVELDVTELLRTVKERGYPFYPAMIWAVSSAVNCREELRMGHDAGGAPGIWDVVSPDYAVFHPEDEQFTRLTTEYSPDFPTFLRRFLEDQLRYQDSRGFEVQAPPNTFTVSCLPWTHYKSFDLHVSGAGLAPTIVWGRYEARGDGAVTMPLTMNIHHSAADGYHLCRFFSDVEHFMKEIK